MDKSINFIVQSVGNNKFDKSIDFAIQPIFDLSRCACIGGEILVRGMHRRNVVPPNSFIKQLEETGGIIPMGDYIIAQALKYISEQKKNALESYLFTINISPIQLSNAALSSQVLALLDKYVLPAKNIMFEITDDINTQDSAVNQNIERLQDAGVNLAWDGIDCLEKLKDRLALYTPDYVKIDRSCLAKNNLDETLLLLDYAQQEGVDVIVEGIENYTQVSAMLRHGVKYGQGFLFSRPVSKELFHKEYIQDKL